MIHFFVGTKAQFIKMAPVMIELQGRGVPFRYVDSGQHAELTQSLRGAFKIGEPDIRLNASDIVTMTKAATWTFRLASSVVVRRRWLREKVFPGGGICLIHGDTLSTFLGMTMARAAGLRIGQVEAGLRSFRTFDPFPEELIRIYCMRRCQLLFAPSEEAAENLRVMKVKGKIYDVGGNTVVDSLRLMREAEPTIDIPTEPFALATCHRLETITRKNRLREVIALLNRTAQSMKVIFVVHKPTRNYLKKFHLDDELDDSIRVLPMQSYLNFSTLLTQARMVLTDGGSIQEECGYLLKPCLVLRQRSERPDGIGKTATMWAFDRQIAEGFLCGVEAPNLAIVSEWPRPSARIVDVLVTDGGDL